MVTAIYYTDRIGFLGCKDEKTADHFIKTLIEAYGASIKWSMVIDNQHGKVLSHKLYGYV